MNFNKCNRCGNFYLSQGDVCPKCQAKDSLEYNTFKSYVLENGLDNLNTISTKTNIADKHIQRFVKYYNNDIGQIKTSNKINVKSRGAKYEQSL